MTSPNKRKATDLFKLSMMDYEVIETDSFEYNVQIKGPADTLYDKGTWTIKLSLPMEYPFKSPSVGFVNRIFHPNVDLISGSICLDVLNAKWSPMYDLSHIVSVFIPQLLQYPNAEDPLNQEAGRLYLENREEYNRQVLLHVEKYACLST